MISILLALVLSAPAFASSEDSPEARVIELTVANTNAQLCLEDVARYWNVRPGAQVPIADLALLFCRHPLAVLESLDPSLTTFTSADIAHAFRKGDDLGGGALVMKLAKVLTWRHSTWPIDGDLILERLRAGARFGGF